MVLVHLPRVALALGRGCLRRGDINSRGLVEPYVSTGRCGLFDADVYGHMNNAAYLVHFELARWEMSAASGFLAFAVRERVALVMAACAVRFRREVGPLSAFEVHTQLTAADERSAYISQSIRPPGGGRALAQSLSRAVLLHGRDKLAPRGVLERCGASDAAIEAVASPAALEQQREALRRLESALSE